jgi:hypothetical protein
MRRRRCIRRRCGLCGNNVRGRAVVGLSTRRRAILAFFSVAAAYVLTLPTVLDLVTSYVTTLDAAIKLADESYAFLEQLRWYDTAGTEIDYYYQSRIQCPMPRYLHRHFLDRTSPLMSSSICGWLDRSTSNFDVGLDMWNVWPLRRCEEA